MRNHVGRGVIVIALYDSGSCKGGRTWTNICSLSGIAQSHKLELQEGPSGPLRRSLDAAVGQVMVCTFQSDCLQTTIHTE